MNSRGRHRGADPVVATVHRIAATTDVSESSNPAGTAGRSGQRGERRQMAAADPPVIATSLVAANDAMFAFTHASARFTSTMCPATCAAG